MAKKKGQKAKQAPNSARIKSLTQEISNYLSDGQSPNPGDVFSSLVSKGFISEGVSSDRFEIKFKSVVEEGLQSVKAAKRITQFLMTKGMILKDAFGMPVNTTTTPTSPQAPQGNVVQTPNNQNNSAPVMYWPAATLWYQQGSEAAKKAGYEYINAVNEYQQENQNSERKLEMAGKMNMAIQSIIQGVAIATEALEGQVQRKRTGDQSATFEISVTEDSLKKMLKTLWVHNVAARSGSHPGVEQKLLEAQLTSRINRISSMTTADDGIPVDASKGENPDNIWQTNTPTPPEQAPDQTQPTQGPETAAATQPTAPTDSQQVQAPPPGQASPGASPTPEEQAAPATEQPPAEPPPTEENQQATTEAQGQPPITEPQAPPAVDGKFPEPESETSLDSLVPPEEAEQAAAQSEGEVPPGPEPMDAEVQPPPPPQMDMSTMKVEIGNIVRDVIRAELPAVLDEYRAAIEEEDNEGEETETPEIQDEAEEPEEGYSEEAEDEGLGDDEVEPEAEESEEVPEVEEPVEEDENVEPEEDEDEEESFYCIECDKDVTAGEISACENENCPLKDSIAQEEEPEPEVEESEEIPEEENIQKHFALVDREDHDGHNVHHIKVKEYTGVEGELCIDCQKMISYSFDQNTWDYEDVSRWVKKQASKSNIETKAAKEVVESTIEQALDYFADDDVLSWIEEKSINKDDGSYDIYGISKEEIAEMLTTKVDAFLQPTVDRISSFKS